MLGGNQQEDGHVINNIHFWTYGDKKNPPLFAVHGFRGTHHGLEMLIEPLTSKYHVIIPDLPGFGKSPHFTDRSHTIENYADTMINLIQNMKLVNPVILGHSMGGTIAARIIGIKPHLCKQLILVNPVSETPSTRQLLPGYAYFYIGGKYLPEKLGVDLLRSKLPILLGSVFMTKTRDKSLRKEIHKKHTTHMRAFSNRRTLMEAFTSANKNSLIDYVNDIHIPSLLVIGKDDIIAPVESHRSLVAKNNKLNLFEIDNVGHLVHYEKPTQAAAAITEFLERY